MLAPIRLTARYLAQIEIWPVALAIAASIVWPGLLTAAVITAAFFWPVRWIAYQRFSLRSPGDLPIALILLLLPVTLYTTGLPEKTWPQVYRVLTGIALYYAMFNWGNSRPRLRWLVNGVVLAGLLLACMAPFSIQWTIGPLQFTPGVFYQRLGPLISDAIHPNVMAGNLVLLLPISAACLLFSWREMSWPERVLFAISAAFILGMLGLTRSRGAWIAVILVIAVLFVLRWRWGWVGLVLAAGLVILANSRIGVSPILELVASDSSIGGLEDRIDIWSRSIFMIRDFPFTGIGMGTFTQVADTLYPFSLALPGTIYHAHNLFLQIAVDLGVLGLIAWMAILFTILTLSWQLYRSKTWPMQSSAAGIGAGLFCSQLALIVHGLTDAVTWGMVRPAPLVWALWGLAVAAWIVYHSSPGTN